MGRRGRVGKRYSSDSDSESVPVDWKECLLTFLHGTIQSHSPLSKLRGQNYVLQTIWEIVCEEWIDLHIDRFPVRYSACKIPELLPLVPLNTQNTDQGNFLIPDSRKSSAGCPVAIVERNVVFPAVASVPRNTFRHQTVNGLYVNMMPFSLSDEKSLPKQCRQYYPLIQKCMERIGQHGMRGVGYLTIDERPTLRDCSEQRGELRVGWASYHPQIHSSVSNSTSKYAFESYRESPDYFQPGVEHPSGSGTMLMTESFNNGMFMVSNMSGTTAVWNCRIMDEDGQFIGAHDTIEHLRHAVGNTFFFVCR